MAITLPILLKLFPQGLPGALKAISKHQALFQEYGISDSRKVSHFLAQCAHETGGFKWLAEQGRQGSSYFKRLDSNKGLGNTHPGDGYKYRGRGFLQITGRWNYGECGRRLKIDLIEKPWRLEEPVYAFLSGLEFWEWNHLIRYDSVEAITKRINGGLNGLVERQRYFHKILNALSH